MVTSIKDIIPKENFDIWSAYLAKKDKGLKKQASQLLNEFILSTKILNHGTLQNLVYYLTDIHRLKEIKIDFRLFERVIFPVLISKINSKKTTANRRLAQFDQFLINPNPLFTELKNQLDYGKNYFEPVDFYQKEIELNNTDQIAIDGFLNRVAIKLNYATHELPEHGLIVDLFFFKEQLNRFKTVLELFSDKEIWSNRIKHWEFVLKTWTGYLKSLKKNTNYQEYLIQNELIFIK